jgi:hypothetical protein
MVHQYNDGNDKVNFSFFATVSAPGEKWSLILLAKDKTNRCHRQFGVQANGQKIWHSASGWCTEPLTIKYLRRICERYLPDRPTCLIVDQYRTHATNAVQAEAQLAGIDLIWIP